MTSLSAWLPILQEALTHEGRFRFPLRGASMRPTLPATCEIEIAPLPPVTPLGALIVFPQGDTLIAHRLVRRTPDGWIAQGDGLLTPDPPVAPDQVLGIVAAAYAGEQRIYPRRTEGPARALWISRHHVLRMGGSAYRALRVLRLRRS